jgi:hypothetical protein
MLVYSISGHGGGLLRSLPFIPVSVPAASNPLATLVRHVLGLSGRAPFCVFGIEDAHRPVSSVRHKMSVNSIRDVDVLVADRAACRRTPGRFGARRPEVFGACAAYAAVLVVFVSNGFGVANSSEGV